MRQPQVFGKYLLLERISVGGMAEVFKARPVNGGGNGKILAIKRILPSMAEDADFIQMFIDEAKISGQLNHGNIAQIYELGRVEDSHFIAMEFVWGKDLLQMQNRFRRIKQTMKPAMAAYIAAKMCEGLDYAHKKADVTGKLLGIIHRDVSPQNILISYDGQVKVIDFGIAKAASRATRTQAGVLKGKFGYMSPEQVRGLPLDRRSDIFAISTILYEMLTAERLFLGESDFATLEKVRNVDVPLPSKMCPNCPPELERIIMKGLAKEADDRYSWASDLYVDLMAFLNVFDPSFGIGQLAGWMKEQFAVELKREQAVLEEQIRGAAAAAGKAAPPAVAQKAPAKSVGLAEGPAEGTMALGVDDLEMEISGDGDQTAEPTQITNKGGDSQAAAGGDAGDSAIDMDELRLPGVADPPATPLASESTRILDDVKDLKPDLPEQSTRILSDVESLKPAAHEMPAQATMILEAPSLPGINRPAAPASTDMPSQSTVMLPAPDLMRSAVVVAPTPRPGPSRSVAVSPALAGTGQAWNRPSQLGRHPETSMVQPIPYQGQKRSSLGKDIFIGVLVAILLVVGVLGGRMLLAGDRARGTLVITVSPPAAVAVLVDGVERGRVAAGSALTIKDVPPGPHQVSVKSDQGSFESKISLAPGDVSVVNATLKDSGGGLGKLRLIVKTKGATVLIDGAQIEEDTWKDAIPLKAGTDHEIRATEPSHDDLRVAVRLKAGEELVKEIDLPPAVGHLSVTTDPPGADVTVNGKNVGETPVKLDNLDPAKEAKISVRKKGFQGINKTVSFERNHHQDFDFKLSIAAQGSPAVAEATSDEPPQRAPSNKGAADEDELADVPPGAKAPKAVPKPSAGISVSVSKPSEDKSAGADEDGFLIANSQPWAKVIIDGKDTGRTTPIAPRSKIPLKPGKHVVTFVANGKSYNFDVMVKPGQDSHLIRMLTDGQ